MFASCESLTNLDLSTFTVINKAIMANMFEGCINLRELNLSSFIITEQNITNNMLDNLTNINKIIVNNNCVESFKKIFNGDKSVFFTN